MKRRFSFTLSGRDWWKPFLVYWLIFLAAYVALLTMPLWAPTESGRPSLFVVSYLAMVVVLLLDGTVFEIIALRRILPRLSVDGRSFGFEGSVARFLGINLLGFLLTIVTATIYLPWYLRRVTAYLVAQANLDGTHPEFLGRSGKLFVRYLLGLLLPIIVVVGAFSLVLIRASTGSSAQSAAVASITAVYMVLIVVITIIFGYLVYKWYANVRWRDYVLRWDTRFWPSCGFLLGQVLLTAITLGIYWPAASLRILRYFVGRTVILDGETGEREVGRLGFEGSIGRGFGLLWGQALLSLVTVGFYMPWAFARVGRWLADNSYLESNAGQPEPV